MNSSLRSRSHVVTRREALGGLVAAAAAVALPGRSWALAPENRCERPAYLWFPDENSSDVFHAYAIEQGSDGTLWVEYDDGNAYGFARGDWSLASRVDGHQLWLRETEDAWYGYRCLNDQEAEELLEEVV